MYNNLEIFTNEQLGEIRTLVLKGKPWFVANDVADILEIKNPHSSLALLDEEEKDIHTVYTLGGTQNVTVINESGLYSLVLKSRKPQAKAFKKWITSEVLPSIRENGMFAVDELLDNPDMLLKTVLKLKEEREARLLAEATIAEQKPIIEKYHIFLDSEGLADMSTCAKTLGLGRNKMMKKLKELKILNANNIAYQRFVDAGYFVIRKMVKNGIAYNVTLVTSKGIDWLYTVLR